MYWLSPWFCSHLYKPIRSLSWLLCQLKVTQAHTIPIISSGPACRTNPSNVRRHCYHSCLPHKVQLLAQATQRGFDSFSQIPTRFYPISSKSRRAQIQVRNSQKPVRVVNVWGPTSDIREYKKKLRAVLSLARRSGWWRHGHFLCPRNASEACVEGIPILGCTAFCFEARS